MNPETEKYDKKLKITRKEEKFSLILIKKY